MKEYGYHPIQTPTFEFFDIFGKEIGTTPSKELYKFFDREGNTLVLRPDMTPSIARAAAKYFMDEDMPIRLCYMGNTFINNSSYQGRLKESTQLGAELIGDSTVDADADGQRIAPVEGFRLLEDSEKDRLHILQGSEGVEMVSAEAGDAKGSEIMIEDPSETADEIIPLLVPEFQVVGLHAHEVEGEHGADAFPG